MNGPFIAVDWGTTNRRAYRVENGKASSVERDGRGVLAAHGADFVREAAELRAHWDNLPMLCSGMVGSRRGWREVPYVATPASVVTLAHGTMWVERGAVAITPGVSHVAPDRCDVMRGEEVQFFGPPVSRPRAAFYANPALTANGREWRASRSGSFRRP